jgi:uncharacterized protein (DUF58 family)
METSELLKKVRHIEIKTRGLSNQIFAGEYHSAFKGKGMTFSEVREYNYGDAIRDIDWNVTARLNHPFVKVFEEERELTVMLLIDVSGSKNFGTQSQYKLDIMTEIAAVLSFSAIKNNDKIGVIMFSDKVEKFIPPQKGRKHILRIIQELLNFEPQSRQTNVAAALEYLTSAIKKRCIAFVISDFIDKGFSDALTIANRKHDIVALRIYDQRETEMPSIGLVQMTDAETGATQWVDTSSSTVREAYSQWWSTLTDRLESDFKRSGVDFATIATGDDYVKPLIGLFKHRSV